MDATSKMGYASYSPFKNNRENVILSNRITMRNTDMPIMAHPDGDMPTMMFPGRDYVFPNSTKVTERRMQSGGQTQPNQGEVNPIMGKENELLSFHLSKLNKTDQAKFLDIYREMTQDEKEQVLERIIQDFQGPNDNFNMAEVNPNESAKMGKRKCEDGGDIDFMAKKGSRKCQDGGMPTNKGGVQGYTTPDGRYFEPQSDFSMYNQSDNMGPNPTSPAKGPIAPPLMSNAQAVKMADQAQKQVDKIKQDQFGIARIQQNLIGEGYKLPKSTKKKGELDGVLRVETQKKGELDGVLGVETQKTIDQFVADRTGYNVQTGMTREEAQADAWSTVLAGSGIISSKFKRFAPLADIPRAKTQTKEIDMAANTTTALPVKNDTLILDESKNYTPVKISNPVNPRRFMATDSSPKINTYTTQNKVVSGFSMEPLKTFKGMPVVESTPGYLILKDVRTGKNVIWDLKKKQFQYTNLK